MPHMNSHAPLWPKIIDIARGLGVKLALDLGGEDGLGSTSCLAEAVGPGGFVLSVEPNPKMFDLLATNTAALPQVHPLRMMSIGARQAHMLPEDFERDVLNSPNNGCGDRVPRDVLEGYWKGECAHVRATDLSLADLLGPRHEFQCIMFDSGEFCADAEWEFLGRRAESLEMVVLDDTDTTFKCKGLFSRLKLDSSWALAYHGPTEAFGRAIFVRS